MQIAASLRDKPKAELRRAGQWLGVDLAGTVSVERSAAAQSTPEHANGSSAGSGAAQDTLEHDLARWQRAVSRRRAAVVVRRSLLLTIVVALILDLLIWVTGGDRRSWWLLVPLAPALLLLAFELRYRVSPLETAQMLDRGLNLHSTVQTAVELNASPAMAGSAKALLAARVQAEAGTAVARSFGTARLKNRPAAPEWAVLAAAAAALVILLAVHAGGSTPSLTAAGGRAAPGGGSSATAHNGGLPRGGKGKVPAGARITTSTSATPTLKPLAPGTFTNPYGTKLSAQAYEHALNAKNAGTHDFRVVHSGARGAGPTQLGEASAKSARPGAAGSPNSVASKLGSGGGGLSDKSTQAPSGESPVPSKLGSGGSPSSGAKKAASPGSPGQAGSAGSEQGSGGGKAPPGGDQAGSAPGSSALGQGLAPDLPHGSIGLPIQAGYAPSTAKHNTNSQGSSQTPNGNGVGGHTATADGGGSGRAGAGLAVIPPSSASTSVGEETQRNNYFGGANQLQLKSW